MSKQLLTGVALSAMMAAGAAQAGPLTLTLDQMDEVTAAGEAEIEIDVEVEKEKYVEVYEEYEIDKEVESFVFTLGYLATAWSDANCETVSAGCIAETQTVTDVTFEHDENGYGFFDATSHSQAVSASQNDIVFKLANGDDNGAY